MASGEQNDFPHGDGLVHIKLLTGWFLRGSQNLDFMGSKEVRPRCDPVPLPGMVKMGGRLPKRDMQESI